MYEDYKALHVERTGKIVTVKFNRPELRNATNPQMHQELLRIFPEIGRDPEAHVVVLTGAGESFSAGGDLNTLKTSLDDQARWIDSMIEAKGILDGLLALDRPVIARINGHAIGLGATLALFCDITIALETAKIADPHVKVGLVAGDGGAIIWPALVGYARAKKYLLTGEAITGAEAAAIGLVTEAVSADRLDARVAEVAQSLADGAAIAIRLTKKAINMSLRAQLDSMIEAHLGYETMSHLSTDHREAVNAFLERRPPVFTGA
jgi:enoyl-CoA hydratase